MLCALQPHEVASRDLVAHGGRTDLDNLVPVCEKHHQNIHNNGWLLTLTPDRILTIQFPDGQIMTTGPPKRAAA
jgi:hypothetical protein